ncbi:MAG TPA: DUF4954 family protein [Chitinispirillaceae bacterium]|nr:DUF4954 family protein [Chitinispirillaceae bacterium]
MCVSGVQLDSTSLNKMEFLCFIKNIKEKKNAFFSLLRQLKPYEIEKLQSQGNTSDDWKSVLVHSGFSTDFIWNNRFIGKCCIGVFNGSHIDTGLGFPLATGIYDSILIDAVICDECCIRNVRGISNYFIDSSALLYNIGTLSCSQSATFGNGRELVIGIETGGREILSFADITIDYAYNVATHRFNGDTYKKFVNSYTEAAKTGYGIIGTRSRLVNCPQITDAVIGESAQCNNILLINNATVQSNADEPTVINHGAYLNNSCVQCGCHIGTMAIVDESILTEHSHVERHGKVTHSIIGPNTGIAEGEVTASLIGPFVGFHHQSMLIGALWPEGKGNVAYGANVGSNHTSKAPDQEIFCGEGVFFGLGSNIKFPSDFSHAPYSIISTGITTLPQRVTFPFSLINSPSRSFEGVSPAYNELMPGWVLSDNLFTIERNQGKYRKRNKARRSAFTFDVFRPDIIDLVVHARNALMNVKEEKEIYLECDIQGIGKNFITRKNLLKGIEAYSSIIERYCLNGLYLECKDVMSQNTQADLRMVFVNKPENRFRDHERAIFIAEGFHKRTLEQNLSRFSELVELTTKAIYSAKAKDDIRGKAIMADYEIVHTLAHEDSFVIETMEKNKSIRDDINQLFALLKNR